MDEALPPRQGLKRWTKFASAGVRGDLGRHQHTELPPFTAGSSLGAVAADFLGSLGSGVSLSRPGEPGANPSGSCQIRCGAEIFSPVPGTDLPPTRGRPPKPPASIDHFGFGLQSGT